MYDLTQLTRYLPQNLLLGSFAINATAVVIVVVFSQSLASQSEGRRPLPGAERVSFSLEDISHLWPARVGW